MKNLFFAVFVSAIALPFLGSSPAHAENRTFTEVAVEVNGVKAWLPSTLVVNKGDHVKIHLVNKIPGKNSVHGFAIDGYKVEELVTSKGKDVEFVADKTGIFQMRCQLHPAHLGGQLVVLGSMATE